MIKKLIEFLIKLVYGKFFKLYWYQDMSLCDHSSIFKPKNEYYFNGTTEEHKDFLENVSWKNYK